jgi:tetratricopeptide (TPR) repeat protein
MTMQRVRAFVSHKMLLGYLVCYLAISGIWRIRNGQPVGILNPTLVEAAVPSAIPPATNTSPTNQVITKWMERVRQNAQDDTAWVHLGEALMQKARETADASYYSRAEATFRNALSLHPHNVSALVGMAWVSGSRHEFEQSIEWAKKAITLDPQNQDAYGLLGDAAVEMGEYDDAFEYYQQMLDIRPNLASYSRAAHLLYLAGDTHKAIWLMQKAIAAGGPYAENTAWCRAQLALMLWNIGALLPAEQVLQPALEQTPNNYHVLVAMGKIKTAQKEYQTAIDYYQKAIASAPQHEAIVALGDLYMFIGQKEKAEQQYALVEVIYQLNKASGVQGGNIQMAQFYADHDRHLPEALQEAEAVYKTRQNIFVADTLAWCYYKNGRYKEAQKFINKAIRLGTPNATILFHAGMIYAKLGVRSLAQKYLYQAVSLNPHFHPLYAALAADTLTQLSANRIEAEG